MANGKVKCWGDNTNGILGNLPEDFSDPAYGWMEETPVDVLSVSNVTQIALGRYHTCVLTTAGAVECWGDNSSGQLGIGTTEARYGPGQVPGLSSGVKGIAAGENHTCVLLESGEVRCWGANNAGQLGNGTLESSPSPLSVPGLVGIAAIAAGHTNTCAVHTTGSIDCWGQNEDGQIGDGTTTLQTSPAQVIGIANAAAVTVGGNHACALLQDDRVKCWGNRAVIGNPGSAVVATAVQVHQGRTITSLSIGEIHSCGITAGGAALCWGSNRYGRLGDGTSDSRFTPAPVTGLASGVTAIAAGGRHTCAVVNGGVKCWGDGYYGTLGNGSLEESLTPVDVSGLGGGVVGIAAGNAHACALLANRSVQCWGENYSGNLGNGGNEQSATPVAVIGVTDAIAISASASHTCVLRATGGVKCWGDNSFSNLGDGTYEARNVPVNVQGVSTAKSIVAGDSTNCAILADNTLKCWGEVQEPVPDRVNGGFFPPKSYTDVALGKSHICGRTSAGGVECWGSNSFGNLGIAYPSYEPILTPQKVLGLSSGVQKIVAAENATCAHLQNAQIWCWGGNVSGLLSLNPGWEPMDVLASQIPAIYQIRGVVNDSTGMGVHGAVIWLEKGVLGEVTYNSGGYLFEMLPPGEYVVTPEMEGYRFVPPSRTVTIPPDADNIDFIALPGGDFPVYLPAVTK